LVVLAADANRQYATSVGRPAS